MSWRSNDNYSGEPGISCTRYFLMLPESSSVRRNGRGRAMQRSLSHQSYIYFVPPCCTIVPVWNGAPLTCSTPWSTPNKNYGRCSETKHNNPSRHIIYIYIYIYIYIILSVTLYVCVDHVVTFPLMKTPHSCY